MRFVSYGFVESEGSVVRHGGVCQHMLWHMLWPPKIIQPWRPAAFAATHGGLYLEHSDFVIDGRHDEIQNKRRWKFDNDNKITIARRNPKLHQYMFTRNFPNVAGFA